MAGQAAEEERLAQQEIDRLAEEAKQVLSLLVYWRYQRFTSTKSTNTSAEAAKQRRKAMNRSLLALLALY